MLKIKLSRTGKKNQPYYRIVVNEARDKRDGSVTDSIGFYYPLTNPEKVTVDAAKYAYWIEKGARPTPTVKHLVEKHTKTA